MRLARRGLALPVVLLLGALIPHCSVASLAKGTATSKSLAKSSSTTAAPANESSNAVLARGKQLLQQKNYALAIDAFTGALSKDDQLKQAYLLRGDCEQQLKKYSQAAGDYSQFASLTPSEPAGYLRASKAYACLGKNNLALSYLSKAVVLSPRDASIYRARAALYDKLGKHAMAVDDRTVATALAEARTQPGKGIVVKVAPAQRKSNDVASSQHQLAGNGQADQSNSASPNQAAGDRHHAR